MSHKRHSRHPPSRLPPWLGYTLGLVGFAWAALGYFNAHFGLGLPKLLFNKHSEIAMIVIYGVPTIFLMRDRYQKIRLTVMITLVFTIWYLIPTLWTIDVEWFGTNKPWKSTFPSFDVPGTWSMAVLFVLALLFGRRVKCGWMNTCVALKETAGAPFRKCTPRGQVPHRLRHIRIVTTAIFLTYFVVLFMPKSAFTEAYFYWFWTIIIVSFFGSLFLSPWLGNRVWCRWICPMPFAWANVLGFFRIRVDRDKCTDCGACEKVCDFGLPIRTLSKKNPMIRTTQCVGCGRCRSTCPQGAISYYDVRDFIRERLPIREPAQEPIIRRPLPPCAAGERV